MRRGVYRFAAALAALALIALAAFGAFSLYRHPTANAALAATSVPTTTTGTTTATTTGTAEATSVAEPQATSTPAVVTGSGAVAGLANTFEDIYTKVNPSVVTIQSTMQAPAQQGQPALPNLPFPGGPQAPQTGPQEALGSGFAWDTQGHIVTNNHVIAGASEIEVTFADGTTVPAKVVGADPTSDLAVLKIDSNADKLPPVTMADSSKVKVGELAVAIGNPFGEQSTMTAGIISALGRSLPAGEGNQSGPTYTIPDVIQTDAPINPGNSGGVLLNIEGQVIGVTSAIESPVRASSGIGFVIPSAIVQKVVPALIKTGHYEHAWLGLSGTTLTPKLAKAMNLPADQRGALVIDLTSGGPAAKAGLQGSDRQATINGQQVPVGGDVIVAINGKPVQTFDELVAYLAGNTSVGDTITLTVLRNGKRQDVKVTLKARPEETNGSQQASGNGNGAQLGIQGMNLSSALAKAMKLPANQQGVLVEQVMANSPAAQAGVRGSATATTIDGQPALIGGDVIVGFDGSDVTNIATLQQLVQQHDPAKPATLTVLRDGNRQQLTVNFNGQ